MFLNYLLTSLRNILRYKSFSIFNILGLTLSMSVCMLIITVLLDQFSYDRFHTKKNRIYRIESIDSLTDFSINRFASTAYPLAEEIRSTYPEAEDVAVISNRFNGEAVVNNIRMPFGGLYTTTSFFNVFDFNLIAGSPEGIFDDPFVVVITEELALKLFGDVNPMGKMLQVDSVGNFRIAGIIRESDKKSHIQFEALASAGSLESYETARNLEITATNWNNYGSNYVYVMLSENANLNDFQKFLDQVSMEKYTDRDETNISFAVQPLTKIVPGPLLANELGMFLPDFMAIFLVALVIVILLLAAFNYTSLSIARSLLRAKEVGLRKTIGASRMQIIVQFLLEAVLISVFALVFAIVLLQFILPGFTSMSMMSLLEIKPYQNITLYFWFFLFTLITGLLAGITPAFFMAAFSPQYVIKGIMNVRLFSRITLRKIFLVIQFVFSMIFIVTTILLMRQMNFMINADMGFDREVVYDIDLQGRDFERVKNEYFQLPEVIRISAASHVPGMGNISPTEVKLSTEEEGVEAHQFSVDENYLETMGIELLAGENFPAGVTTGQEKFVLVDELFVNNFNLGTVEEAVGKDIILDDSILLSIIGIVKDYQYAALFLNPRPLILRVRPEDYNIAVLRLHTLDTTTTVNRIKKVWKGIDPNHEIRGDFLDAQIRAYYSLFEDVLYVMGYATVLIMIIAGLGLLGMATYSIQTRMKEIGIRKVFGARRVSVLISVSRSYIWLLVTAAIIAAPVAYLINNLWLRYLARHVTFGIGTIFSGIMFIIVIGLLTIASQTTSASRSNPADILKYE